MLNRSPNENATTPNSGFSIETVAAPENHQHIELCPTTEQPTAFKIYFFGSFRVEVNGHMIDKWPSRKAKQLFAYMLLNHKRFLCRDVLMEKFWPQSQPECSRNSLNGALHTIRQTLHRFDHEHEYILFKDDCYYFNPEIQLWVDVEEFMKHWQRARTGEARKNIPTIVQELESAKVLYKNDFMEEDLYDEWTSTERENFKEMYLAVLDRLSEGYVFSNQFSPAARLCEDILEKDDCREDIHRRLMLCYYRTGNRDKALRQFKKCSEALKAELEVEPTKTTRLLYGEIRNDRVSPTNLSKGVLTDKL